MFTARTHALASQQQGYGPYSFGYRFRPPARPWGFPHGLCLPCRLAGLALTRVTHLGVRLPLLSGIQPDPLAPAQGAPYPSPALPKCPVFCTARPITCTGAFFSESTPRDHTPFATQTSGALLLAYGTSPSLECDSGHTRVLSTTVRFCLWFRMRLRTLIC